MCFRRKSGIIQLYYFITSAPNFFKQTESKILKEIKLFTDRINTGPKPPLLEWGYTAKKLPWGVILMLGGGFALANACKVGKIMFYQ